MKRTHRSRMLFFGAWFTVLVAGFMTSRASIFAATGKANCVDCAFCEYLMEFWDQGTNKDWGYVTQGQGTPVLQALAGTQLGASNDIWAYGCDGYNITVNENTIYDDVNYASADFGCTTKTPIPPGRYAITNATGMTYYGASDYQTDCY